MGSVNRVQLIGNVGKEPALSGSGTVVCKFTVATQDYKDETCWHNIACFGKTAELVQKYVTKGKQVYLEGRISNRTFEKKDGTKGFSSEVIADRVVFLGGGKHKEEANGAPVEIPATDSTEDMPF